MRSLNTDELLKTLDLIVNTPILVVGDMILDRYVWGKVDRISPEAPVPVVEVETTEDRLGGAGNVVRNLARIGAKVSACGLIGDDDEGQTMLSLLADIGADKEGVLIDRSRPTILKTRVIAQKQQMVRIDREKIAKEATAISEGLAGIVDAHVDANKAVILSDYGKGAISMPVLRRIEEAWRQKRLGMGVRPLFVDPHPHNYNNYIRMSVAKPNRKEAEIASGIKIRSVADAVKAADVLMARWNSEMMVITLGEDGMLVKRCDDVDGLHLETTALEVFDVSGAGDTVTAILSAALAVGATPIIAGELSNIAAGVVVSEVGTFAIDSEQLKKEILRISDEGLGKKK
jgi:D-beta-D-heptose 7-phosphate kinase/D-beta-D-heptose 1-phosphate adenosyltransferase